MAENWFEALSDEMANGVSATDAVGAVLGGPAGMATIGASAAARMAGEGNGGSWSFDKDEIDAVIADWKALAEELDEDRRNFFSAQRVFYPPSEDQPPVKFMSSLREGIVALEEFNNSMRDYVAEFVEKLEAAKKSISEADDAHVESFRGGNFDA
ncbi:hypothetical protein [Saccharomonospora xinjiangensis]|uniref:PE domain-containing protein n=1 Tax=Saccharomonospora xinjiangensis XJ-54 TaxID=882086 RepID=I0UWX0_9PSEU|nr:hypothetical protein [Saccharomonospora xinjiangensis]EID52373.1 hypothetical protein SacxiDRAFT_0089 [Saccharomonospora xinjiangensis XJ-54]